MELPTRHQREGDPVENVGTVGAQIVDVGNLVVLGKLANQELRRAPPQHKVHGGVHLPGLVPRQKCSLVMA